MQKRILFLPFFLLLSLTGFAQNKGAIKGFVYDKKTGEPIIYTIVNLENTKYGVVTDVNGYFSISDIPPGTYTLMTTLLGYDTAKTQVTVRAGNVISQKLFISPRQISLKDVEVTARKTEKITHVNVGVTTITPRDMELLPSAGGEPDVAQFLQVVPGVVFTGDQGGQLYIRGGSPAQTGIYLDGVTIYNPFHSIGLYSVFETEAIKNVDVQTAGFNASYGNRTSAIVDVHTIDGNKHTTEGLVSVSPIMTRLMLQGPIMKAKQDNSAAITYVLSAKSSYLDQTSKTLYSGLGSEFANGLPYKFTDLFGKVTFSSENGSKLNVFGFNFTDDALLDSVGTSTSVAEFKWQATGGGATFVVTPSGSSTLISGKFAYSNYNISETQLAVSPQSSSIGGFEAGINFTNYLPGFSEIQYGLEVDGYHSSFSYRSVYQDSTGLSQQNTLANLFLVYRKDFNDKLIFEPSVRVQYYSEISTFSVEPRIGLKYNISDNVRLKAASGLYTEDIISTKSDVDIVNYFTGFFLSPQETIYDNNGNAIKTNLQSAVHLVGGIEVDVNKVEFNLEPWMKDFTRNILLNENKRTNSDPDFQDGTAYAYGTDLSAKYSYGRVYLWGVVDYQVVNYTNIGPDGAVQTYPAPFDRRININLLGSYTAGKKKQWDLSARFNFGSPFPFTQTQGFYEGNNVLGSGVNGTLNNNILNQNGPLSFIYSNQINGGRLSYYHRLDVSVRRKFMLGKSSDLDLTASVTNVYDRENIFYVDRLTNSRVYQLPLFPSLNATWHF